MLALNFLPADRPTPERYFQFALSPEDDARAVGALHRRQRPPARRGAHARRRLGHARGRGIRRRTARRRRLRARPGELRHRGAHRLRATASCRCCAPTTAARATQRIQATIGQKLEFEPRRRPDIQFIFAPSQPRAARLLRPQLRFHLAGDIPTYTLGDAYEPHPTANQEIDGVMFPDMPWMLGDDGLVGRGARSRAPGLRRFGRAPRAPVRVRLRRLPHRRRHCSAAAPINPAGPHRHAVDRRAGSRAPRARMGAHQGRRTDAARAQSTPPRQPSTR